MAVISFSRRQNAEIDKVFREFGLIEILTDGAYYMTDVQLLIVQSSSEGGTPAIYSPLYLPLLGGGGTQSMRWSRCSM